MPQIHAWELRIKSNDELMKLLREYNAEQSHLQAQRHRAKEQAGQRIEGSTNTAALKTVRHTRARILTILRERGIKL